MTVTEPLMLVDKKVSSESEYLLGLYTGFNSADWLFDRHSGAFIALRYSISLISPLGTEFYVIDRR